MLQIAFISGLLAIARLIPADSILATMVQIGGYCAAAYLISKVYAGMQTLLHESGHALIASLFGQKIEKISIGKPDSYPLSLGSLEIFPVSVLQGNHEGLFLFINELSPAKDFIVSAAGPLIAIAGSYYIIGKMTSLMVSSSHFIKVLSYSVAYSGLKGISTDINNITSRKRGDDGYYMYRCISRKYKSHYSWALKGALAIMYGLLLYQGYFMVTATCSLLQIVINDSNFAILING